MALLPEDGGSEVEGRELDPVLLFQLLNERGESGLLVAVGGISEIEHRPHGLRIVLLQQLAQLFTQARLPDAPHAVVDEDLIVCQRKLRGGLLENLYELFPIGKPSGDLRALLAQPMLRNYRHVGPSNFLGILALVVSPPCFRLITAP